MKRRLINIAFAALIIAFSGQDIRAMAEQYPMQITAEKKNKTAEIRITGTLYNWNNSAEEITQKIDGFLEAGCNDVLVYVNSPGGDVFVAAEIINQLNRFPGIKKGIGGALVASAATMIAIELDSFEMAENGQFMYHKPSTYLGGNEDKIESSLKLLKDLTAQYKKKYADKTGKTEEEIEAAWAKGDVWLTATEAQSQKFISGVIKKTVITPDTQALFVACGSPVVPDIESETSNPKVNMKNRNEIIAKLKLSADATDEQIEAAVTAAMEKAGQVDSVTAEADKAKKTQVEEFVDAAIVAKKTTADQRDNLITMGMANFENLKSFVASLPSIEKPNPGQGSGGNGADVRANWTMEDYQEKDPDALATMMVEKPEDFKKLETAYYGK